MDEEQESPLYAHLTRLRIDREAIDGDVSEAEEDDGSKALPEPNGP